MHKLMHQTTPIVGVLLLFIYSSFNVATANDKYAEKNMELAFSQCERALQMEIPRSAVSLRVLQRYLKKYELYRAAALKISSDLLISNRTYASGLDQASDGKDASLMLDKSYADMDSLCKDNLKQKLQQATTQVNNNIKSYQQRFGNVTSPAQKQARAKFQASIAVNRYCGRYILPLLLDATEKIQVRLDQDFQSYKIAKQKAQEIDPNILSVTLTGLMLKDKKSESITQEIKTWFQYCDAVFPDYSDNLNALKMVDDSDIETITAETIEAESLNNEDDNAELDDLAEEETANEGDDPYWDELLTKVTGAKLGILIKYQREPDMSNNDEFPIRASVWKYDSDTGTGCIVYKFKADHLLETKKSSKTCN